MRASAFLDWLRSAAPGDEVVYHEGPNAFGCDAAEAAMNAAGYRRARETDRESGWVNDRPMLVELFQRRLGPFSFSFVARRISDRKALR